MEITPLRIAFNRKSTDYKIIIEYFNNRIQKLATASFSVDLNQQSPQQCTQHLISTHSLFFNSNVIKKSQLEAFILKLKEYRQKNSHFHENNMTNSTSPSNTSSTINSQSITSTSALISPDQNPNDLEEEQLEKIKKIMDVEFQKGRLKPGDKDFVYDKRIDFTEGTEDNDWDE